MSKKVQIDEMDFLDGLFLALCIKNSSVIDEEIEELADKVAEAYSEKLEAMIKRTYYTKYKTAPTEEEKEQARIEYLAHADIIVDSLTFEKILAYQREKRGGLR